LEGPFRVDAANDWSEVGTGILRNPRGPAIPEWASFQGILYTTGDLRLGGDGRIYGSVIVLGDAELAPGADGRGIFWDETILGDWPPPSYTLPKVIFTSWRTD
jgi:hypothetical protein